VRPAASLAPPTGPPPSIAVLLVLMTAILGGCTAVPEIPRWFDAIERMPIHTILVSGHRIAYLDTGEGPPVILIHGFGGSLWQWEYQQRALSAEHRLITLDVLGSGYSDKPDLEYRPEQLVEFFRGFMDALNLPRASLIGNSMGAGLAIGMALTYPERVDRLVLIGGLPDRIEQKLASPLIRQAIETRVPIWLASLGNWLLGRSLTETVLREIVHDSSLLTPAVIDRSHRNRRQASLIGPLLTIARNLPLWEDGFAKRLGEIRHPTLILWGSQDRVFPPQVGHELHRTIPGSTLAVIPNAGHIPQWEQPQAVNPVLIKFLQP
jgi:pimeloyl-ACP methyl ester carboxylesterase